MSTIPTNKDIAAVRYNGTDIPLAGGESGFPIEVSTDAGMEAVLTSDNVGKAYKYTGTGSYINGAIYVVASKSGSLIFETYGKAITIQVTGSGDSYACKAAISGTEITGEYSGLLWPNNQIEFTIKGSGPLTGRIIIDGETVTSSTGTIKTYQWSVPSGTNSVDINLDYTPGSNSGTITVTTS